MRKEHIDVGWAELCEAHQRGCGESRFTRPTLHIALLTLLVLLASSIALAHEHPPLPSKGVAVHGNQVFLSPSASKSIALTTTKIKLADLDRVITANASIVLPWKQQTVVTTLAPSRVERVLVGPGDEVAAGQELARVQSLDLETLQLQLLQANSELALAERMLKEREILSEAISGKILLETRAMRQQKAAEREIVRHKLRALGLTDKQLAEVEATGEPVRSLPLVSPRRGIISDAEVRAGQMVQPTEHLFHIVDLSALWAIAHVLEADMAGLQHGEQVEITVNALPDRVFRSEIHEIHLKIDPQHRCVMIRADLDNQDGLLRPGMFGNVRIQVEHIDQAIVCPTDSILRDGEKRYVFLEQRLGKYERREVATGLRVGKTVEILDGLFPGDQVVDVGRHELASLFHNDEHAHPENSLRGTSQSMAPSISTSGFRRRLEGEADIIHLNGRVELPTDCKYFASSGIHGKLARIRVEHNERVKRGQVLAEIESLEFKNMQLDLIQAHTQLDWTQASLERARAASETQAIARKELWQLEARYAEYEHAVRSLTHKLLLVGLSAEEIERVAHLDLTTPSAGEQITARLAIRSPGNGLVADFDLIPGQAVRPGDPLKPGDHLFEIHDLRRMWVQAFLFERDAQQVHAGQTAEVRLAADSAFRAIGKVTRTSPVSTNDRIFSVWIELDNPDSRVREGMAARVTIDTSSVPATLAAERK